MVNSLFRDEALRFANRQAMGDVIVVQPVRLKVLTALLFFIIATSLSYLCLGEYSRKESVRGYLEPMAGTVEIYAQSSRTVIDSVLVVSGDEVSSGTVLVKLKANNFAAQGEDSLISLLRELGDQRDQLVTQLERNGEYYRSESLRLKARITDINAEVGQQQQFLSLQHQRVKLVQSLLNSVAPLRETGAVSESDWSLRIADKLEQQKEVIAIEHRLIQLQSNRKAAVHDLQQLPAKAQSDDLQIKLQLSTVEQRAVEIRARQNEVLISPVSGTVSAVQAKVGNTTVPDQPLLTIVPESSSLECVLLLPSSAIGFIEPGLELHLKFDAYPYQQFGTFPATLLTVSQSTTAPHQLRAPIRTAGPVYIARAIMPSNIIRVMNEERLLQPGMLLTADVILERRTFLNWLLEPIYSVLGKS